jgi:hypothetical protein
VESTRKLRSELTYEVAKLNGLQRSGDLTVDDASTKALAMEIRRQAGICLGLLDRYQSSLPGRMWSYAENKCQPLREDLKRTEMHFREVSGEFQRSTQRRTYRHPAREWSWDEIYEVEDCLDSSDSGARNESKEAHATSDVALSRRFVEAHNCQDLDGLMILVDDGVEFKRAFDPPLHGKAAVRLQYEQDWADHKSVVVNIRQVFEAEGMVAIEIHVDSGPPSNVLHDGVVVLHWNEEGRLARYHLYVDEVTSVEETS